MSRDQFAERLGRPDLAARDEGASGFSCPECHGNLWELAEAETELIQYQCRVGHMLSVESLIAHQATAIETMLWTALNALQERSAFLRRLDRRYGAKQAGERRAWVALADAADQEAELVQRALQGAMRAQD